MSGTTLPNQSSRVISEDALTEEVFGEIVDKLTSAASIWIANQIQKQLGTFVAANRLGWSVVEGYFILDRAAKLKRRPDVAFVSKDRWPLDKALPLEDDWEVIPDLAVEVISPSNRMEEMTFKVGDYLRYGVLEVWVVLPREQQVYVYNSPDHIRIVQKTTRLTTPVVPGWELDLEAVFRLTA